MIRQLPRIFYILENFILFVAFLNINKMANTNGTDTGVSPDGSTNTGIIHTINVRKINNKFRNKINKIKKVHYIISGKLYGMNIDIYYKNRSVAGEIGLIDSGSAYSLMGINK